MTDYNYRLYRTHPPHGRGSSQPRCNPTDWSIGAGVRHL